jgi:hypothetical protein
MAEPREPAGDVDWQGLEAAAAAENRPEVVERLRQLRDISLFNSVVIRGGNPLATLLEENRPAPPIRRRRRRWLLPLVGLGIVMAAAIFYLVTVRPD